MIEKKIGRGFDTITAAQMVDLQSIFVSVRDGIATIGDYFEIEQADVAQGTGPKTGVEAVKARTLTTKPEQKPTTPEAASEPFDDDYSLEAEMLANERREAQESK